MSAAGNDNLNDENDDNGKKIIFTIKDAKLYVPVVTLSDQRETIKNYKNFLAEDQKDQFIVMNIKQKVKIKLQEMKLDIFLNQTLLELKDYLYQFNQINMKILLTKRNY